MRFTAGSNHSVIRLLSVSGLMIFLPTSATPQNDRIILGNLPPMETDIKVNQAQRAQAADEFDTVDAFGAPGSPVRLQISLPAGSDVYTFVMIKGLPAGFKLSAGFPTKDAWAVSVRDVAGVSLIPPAGFSGAFALEVMLVKGADEPAETRKLRVALGRQPAAPTETVVGVRGPKQTGPLTANITGSLGSRDVETPQKAGLAAMPGGISPEEENALMSRAGALLKNADVPAARMLYEHLASRGSARAAFAMGQTHDPDVLKSWQIAGVPGDTQKAREWYRKSLELGGTEAVARLSALANKN
jgi:hypothetical protein